MNEILAAFAEHDLKPNSVTLDGKIHRFKADKADSKNSAWYLGFANHTRKSGETFNVVVFGNFQTGLTSTYQSGGVTLTADDRKYVKEQIAKAKKIEEAARLALQEQTAREVEELWQSLSDAGSSEYLERKLISECPNLGVKFDTEGNIYVPMRDGKNKLWSLQRIDVEGSKRFHACGRVRGCFHVIGHHRVAGGIIYVAEGFATAASIHLATTRPVVCAFNAGNLESVARECAPMFPDGSFVVCGDDDRWTKRPDGTDHNPGRIAAETVAEILLGTAIFPKFAAAFDPEVKGSTDFNDLHANEGVDKVREQLKQAPEPEKHYVLALGHNGDDYFFTTSSNQQIVKTSTLSKNNCMNLMPIEYWERAFPGAGSGKVDWDMVQSKLMFSCRERGLFELQNVRGAGVWQDDGRIVVNMGDYLIVDGRPIALGRMKSRFFYTLGKKLPPLAEPLTADECDPLTKAAELFRWKKTDFGFLLAGAMVTSRVCGGLPIRPHLWVTGERGSGKTTLFNRFIKPLLGDPIIDAVGNSTEAGLRQKISSNAIPMLIDEFETSGPRSEDNIRAVLDLMRVAWSETHSSVIKGSATGSAVEYQARFSAIVASIRQLSLSDADNSRFATIELRPHDSDPEHWRELSSTLDILTIDYGNRLFARTIRLLPVLLENFKLMKAALNRRTPGQRFGDQYGMLLAGYCILLQDDVIDDAQADFVAGNVTLEDEREEAQVVDQEDALTHLLTTKTTYKTVGGVTHDALIGDLIQRVINGGDASLRDALLLLGIHIKLPHVSIISRNHAELQSKVFRNTRWSESWGKALARLPGAEPNKGAWFKVKTEKCVRLPVALFVPGEK